MSRKIVWIAALLLASILCLAAGLPCLAVDSPPRDVEAAGGFSLIPPEGWMAKEFPGLKYKIIAGPAANKFAPNINVVDETYTGTLSSYVDENLTMMQKVFKGIKIIHQADFDTADGLHGKMLVAEDDQQQTRLRQTFYFFANGDRKYVITCSALADGADAFDAQFESSVKTFRFEK